MSKEELIKKYEQINIDLLREIEKQDSDNTDVLNTKYVDNLLFIRDLKGMTNDS